MSTGVLSNTQGARVRLEEDMKGLTYIFALLGTCSRSSGGGRDRSLLLGCFLLLLLLLGSEIKVKVAITLMNK